MLTPAVIVLVIWTRTGLASRFDRVGLAAVADHRYRVCIWVTDRRALGGHNRHALGQCSLGPRFDFDIVFAFAIFVIHGLTYLKKTGASGSSQTGVFLLNHALSPVFLYYYIRYTPL